MTPLLAPTQADAESRRIGDQHRHFDEILKRSGQTHVHEDRNHVAVSSSTVTTRAKAFYAIPAVKFIQRGLVQTYGTLLYFVLVYKFKSPSMVERDRPLGLSNSMPFLHDANPIEIMWLVYEIGVWLDLRHQQLMRNRSHVHAEGSLERVRLVSDALIIIALGIRITMEVGYQRRSGNEAELDEYFSTARDLYEAYQVVIALKVIVMGSAWMPFVSEYQRLGVLFIMVTEMINDVVDWILLFTVVTGSFMLSFLGLQKAGHYTNDAPHDGWEQYDLATLQVNFADFAATAGLWSPLWSLFGEFDCTRYSWLASIMMWIYMLTGSIVLVNLLVAMFAETFGRVKEQSEMEYVYLRCTRLFEYKHVILAVPPMINAPIVFSDFALHIANGKTARKLASCFGSLVDLCACFCRGRGTEAELLAHRQESLGLPSRSRVNSISEKTDKKKSLSFTPVSLVGGKTASFEKEPRSVSPAPSAADLRAQRASIKRMSIVDGGLGGAPPRNSKGTDLTPRDGRGSLKGKMVPLNKMKSGDDAKKLYRSPTKDDLGRKSPSNQGSGKKLLPPVPQKRKPNLFDGKLLANDYLKKVHKEEADTVHALTRSLRHELQVGMKQREADFLRLATRVGGLEHSMGQMDEMTEAIKDVQTTLHRLAQGSGGLGVIHSEG